MKSIFLADAGKLPLHFCFHSFVVDLNLCLIGAGFFKLMFQSRMDTCLQTIYFSATHFCPAHAPTQAPLQRTLSWIKDSKASCAGKPNKFGNHNQGEHQCWASSKQECEKKKKLLEPRGSWKTEESALVANTQNTAASPGRLKPLLVHRRTEERLAPRSPAPPEWFPAVLKAFLGTPAGQRGEHAPAAWQESSCLAQERVCFFCTFKTE